MQQIKPKPKIKELNQMNIPTVITESVSTGNLFLSKIIK